jgi:hypothetical protein
LAMTGAEIDGRGGPVGAAGQRLEQR